MLVASCKRRRRVATTGKRYHAHTQVSCRSKRLKWCLKIDFRPGRFEIVRLLPPRDGEFQYRIKSIDEPHERVAKESLLRRL